MTSVIGIDLGGTNIRAGLANERRELIAETRHATISSTPDALIRQLLDVCIELRSRSASPIEAIGIGGAGAYNAVSNQFGMAPNLDGMTSSDFLKRLESALDAPVIIENDVNIAALGELHYGVGLGVDTFAVIAVGTGIGAGLIYHGDLIRGVTGAAGEIGYLPFGADPFSPKSQMIGALEQTVSGDALRRRVPGAHSAVNVFDRAAKGFADGIDAVAFEGEWIALAITAIESVLNLQTYVLTGGIGSRVELLAAIHSSMRKLGRHDVQIQLSQLGEHAALLGATELALSASKQLRKEIK
ncbi:MAG: ROK family protein [Bifidobacterium tibiigranuli]|jgi:predicted NBD/HSP70 family sugar kinase|uniref:ROK family protein n=1 Tax=Bifidobacterium tibiigranuli TaxID=2172043 RepID=UPI0026F06DD6|nr:ROK family protein [Bifidobacterium tibiigranuli]MCI1674419.1 ROK family protein [Bifidobacterium tibiigranuli]MCI1713931.1 ROK family protein [Bifidobacterium tibiigranuli]MCI1834731.1 ROK family protein [Bifidobacterium tibiigranuli]